VRDVAKRSSIEMIYEEVVNLLLFQQIPQSPTINAEVNSAVALKQDDGRSDFRYHIVTILNHNCNWYLPVLGLLIY